MTDGRSTLEQIKESLSMYRAATMGLEQEGVGLGQVANMMTEYFDSAIQARARGEPLAWINFGVVSELFWAMDVVPVVVEVITGLVAPTDGAARYIDLAEEHVPDHVCSSNKVLLGAMLSGEVAPPDFIIHPSQPCDSNLATYPVMAERFGCPYYCIDVPYLRDESAIRYVASELDGMVALIEDRSGRRLDLDRLREVMTRSNEAHRLFLELATLRQAVPCPTMGLDTLAEYPAVLTLAGRPELVTYLEGRIEVAGAKVAKGEGFLRESEERHRLVWIYGAPAFDLFLFMWLEQEHGAVSVANMNSNFVMRPVEDLSSRESIMLGLARKLVQLPMTRECGGPLANYIDSTIDLCRRYRADAAIFAGHLACKANWAAMKLTKDRIQQEAGIPVFVFELDLFDERVVSSETIQERFETFFSSVLAR